MLQYTFNLRMIHCKTIVEPFCVCHYAGVYKSQVMELTLIVRPSDALEDTRHSGYDRPVLQSSTSLTRYRSHVYFNRV